MATVQRARISECRRCRTFCDKLIEPRGCIEIGCRYLYSYEDHLTGGRYTVIASGYPPVATGLSLSGGGLDDHDLTLGHPDE